MTDKPDKPDKPEPEPTSYPPPQFAPAAPQEDSESWKTFVPPQLSPAAPVESAPAPEPAAAAAEEPLLPATFHENDLRTAIGSPAMPEQIRAKRPAAVEADDDDDIDDEGRPRRRNRRTTLVIAGSLFVGLSIAALVILGRVNSGRYVVSCEPKQVVAEQGRSFPPWGTSRLGGDEWKPIAIPPNFQCTSADTDDLAAISDIFRKTLVSRADALLAAREVVQIDEAAAMLDQALLHARSDSEAHKDARVEIQRMLGDVGYWKASAKLRDAATALGDAAKEFETAAAQRPRHVTDASAWAGYIRKLVDELRAGPAGIKPAATPAEPVAERPRAPAGVALPVEPTAGSGSAGSAEPPLPAAPDAGVPSGGVLL